MKKILVVLLIAVASFIVFSFATTKTVNVVESNKLEKVEQTSHKEEVIYCKIIKDGTTVTCWFCDCDELAKILTEKQK